MKTNQHKQLLLLQKKNQQPKNETEPNKSQKWKKTQKRQREGKNMIFFLLAEFLLRGISIIFFL